MKCCVQDGFATGADSTCDPTQADLAQWQVQPCHLKRLLTQLIFMG